MNLNINDILLKAVEQGASDIHLRANAPPMARIQGKMQALKGFALLTAEDLDNFANRLMSLQHKKVFKETNDCDLSYALAGSGRFRVNVFRERGSVGIVLRTINAKVKTLTELGLPPVLKKIANEHRGIILVTGATGSGKSTTLAALIDHINEHHQGHILTIEDPIEYVHPNKNCVVSQREIGADTDSFSSALRAALRQDPDVILVGEMRDQITVEIGIKAAETGHLVFATLHTVDATETINRIIGYYPPEEQHHVRLALASVLKSVISQRLLRKKGGGRVAALEIMIVTEFIKDLIRDPERAAEIKDAIERGASQYGMQSFDQAIFSLEKRDIISREEALLGTTNPDEYMLKMKGFATTSESTMDMLSSKDAEPEVKKPVKPKEDDLFEQNPFRKA